MTSEKSKNTESETDSSPTPQIDFKTLVNLSDDAILLIGGDGVPAYISPSCERLLGWSADKLAAELHELVYIGADDKEADLLHRILCGNGDPKGTLPCAELQLRSALGTMVWAEVTTHLLRDGATHAFVIYMRNIARRKELEGLLEAANQTDPLTGLLNRRAFDEALKREWAVALREKTHTSLIKVSLDRFDALSEEFGSGPASECLTRVSRTLTETARRPADIAARTASSEFSLLLPRTHELGAETISAYLQIAIQDLAIPNPVNVAGNGVVTASVGAVCVVADQTGVTESVDFIVSAAEDCVFQARQEGGNRVKTIVSHLER